MKRITAVAISVMLGLCGSAYAAKSPRCNSDECTVKLKATDSLKRWRSPQLAAPITAVYFEERGGTAGYAIPGPAIDPCRLTHSGPVAMAQVRFCGRVRVAYVGLSNKRRFNLRYSFAD